jgi:hypothetical protein
VRYACPCCAFLTLERKPPGTYDTCPVCVWEDDRVQFAMPDFRGEANRSSLREARACFVRIGVSDERHLVRARKPREDELPK